MGKATKRVMDIREKLLDERVELSRMKCIEMGMPDRAFDAQLARRNIDLDNSVMMVAILDYLDELAESRGGESQ